MEKLFVGIDFSKEKLDAVIITADEHTDLEERVYGEFMNSTRGFRQLEKWVEKNSHGISIDNTYFCGENTGDYSKPLCNFLFGKGYQMWLENAKCIKDASGLRRLKSDRADASMIAEYVMRNYDKACLYKPLSDALYQLRELFLYRQTVVRHKCSFTVRRSEKDLTMKKCPIKNVISRSSKHLLREFDKEIDKLDKQIADLIESNEELKEVYQIVTSIPGIGCQNAVCLMVYTNNFRKFNYNPRKIACFYGIAPFGRDSGTSVHSDPHVHFMANRQLKAILTQAALVAIRYNPLLAQYYERLIVRGKKTQVALNNVKNKLIHIITAMVRNRQVFDLNYHLSA